MKSLHIKCILRVSIYCDIIPGPKNGKEKNAARTDRLFGILVLSTISWLVHISYDTQGDPSVGFLTAESSIKKNRVKVNEGSVKECICWFLHRDDHFQTGV